MRDGQTNNQLEKSAKAFPQGLSKVFDDGKRTDY